MKKINNKKWINQNTQELFEAILSVKDIKELQKFLRDLMTESEIIEFGKRWKVARMLYANATYVEITKETGLSSTTIARVQNWLTEGTGGYNIILKRTDKNDS